MEGLITSSVGVLFVLAANCAFWFFLEKKSGWRIFNFIPPLIFIYMIPAVFSNGGLIPGKSPVYDWMGDNLLPVFLTLLLLDVDVRATVKVMGRGVFVMLIGSLGVIIGAPVGYLAVKGWLVPEAWKGFGALAGSWIGGTGNMAAVSEGLGTSGTDFGLAVIADNVVYLIWLPILLQSKNLAKYFHKFTGVTDEHLNKLKTAADDLIIEKDKPQMRHLLYLFAIALGVAALATEIASIIPALPPVLTTSTYKILLVTTIGLILSFTPAKKIPGSHELAMALVYLFVARMGAKAVVTGLVGQAVPFVAGAYIWIFIHGIFILIAARIFRIDVHTAAISSAANIGGAASSPIVAAFHDERLVPVSILMALIGYAVGNYGAFLAAWLCSLLA
ncbi:MAG: DUF819 family protein [Candidatus Zixiibacteriota bacterium]|nr:MAG: DUF819 family protein [candidate division Zixibacteria bacterium]